MKNLLLLALLCVVGFLLYRDWTSSSDPAQARPAQNAPASALPPNSPPDQQQSMPAQEAQRIAVDPVAERIAGISREFPIRAAVDRMAKRWEQERRNDFPVAIEEMRRVGEKEFAIIVRRMQDKSLYAEDELVRIVRAALGWLRPNAPQEQREVLLDGIFKTMRVNKPPA